VSRGFTHDAYRRLLRTLKENQYRFYTFHDYAEQPVGLPTPHVILRHDVDRMPHRAKKLAQIESDEGARGTYFFRTRRASFDREVIRIIQDLGHEVGYHYENLSDCRGNVDDAWRNFQTELRRFDFVGGVGSIAMHGRPLSPWDNRNLWQHYDYRQAGVRLEAYLDVDWQNYLYLTDTGRTWSGGNNFRDHVVVDRAAAYNLRSLEEICRLVEDGSCNFVISTHPERWSGSLHGWAQVWVTDSAINLLKRVLRGKTGLRGNQ
jgi:hypothetical protein